MGFLRRLLGGARTDPAGQTEPPPPLDDPDIEAAEKAYELELLREEQERLSELTRRQMRYADYAWTPPAQGGERRADQGDADEQGDPADGG
jgi:hypothetical protein